VYFLIFITAFYAHLRLERYMPRLDQDRDQDRIG